MARQLSMSQNAGAPSHVAVRPMWAGGPGDGTAAGEVVEPSERHLGAAGVVQAHEQDVGHQRAPSIAGPAGSPRMSW